MGKNQLLPYVFFINAIPALSYAACPAMAGTYQLEGSPYKFYIQHNEKENIEYNIIFEISNNQYLEQEAFVADEKQRQHQHLPACAMMIPRMGMLTKTKKGEKVQVSSQSQNYLTEKTLTGDYALWIFTGFASDVINVNKLSNSSQVDKKLSLAPKQPTNTDQTTAPGTTNPASRRAK